MIVLVSKFFLHSTAYLNPKGISLVADKIFKLSNFPNKGNELITLFVRSVLNRGCMRLSFLRPAVPRWRWHGYQWKAAILKFDRRVLWECWDEWNLYDGVEKQKSRSLFAFELPKQWGGSPILHKLIRKQFLSPITGVIYSNFKSNATVFWCRHSLMVSNSIKRALRGFSGILESLLNQVMLRWYDSWHIICTGPKTPLTGYGSQGI